MPLFFFISGCARSISESNRGGITNLKELVRFYWKSFLTLIVPALSWTYLVPLFFTKGGAPQEFKFWFLSVLFVIMLIWGGYSYIYHKLGKREWVTFMLVCVIAILFLIGIKRIPLMYLSMFILGYYFQRKDWLHKIKEPIYSVLAIAFCLIVGYFQYSPNGSESVNRIWTMFPISIIASFVLTKLFLYLVTNVLGTMKVLGSIGQHTIAIYLCHFYFIDVIQLSRIEECNLILQFIILMGIGICISMICIIIENAITPFGLMHGILYGKWNRKHCEKI